MYSKYDMESFIDKLSRIRSEFLDRDPSGFPFCSTQEKFALELGVGRQTVLNWENKGKKKGKDSVKYTLDPHMSNMIKLCNKLDIDMNYLLGCEEYVDTPNATLESVSEYVGISIKSVRNIRHDKSLQDFLNYLLDDSFLDSMMARSKSIINTRLVATSLLDAFDGSLQKKIRNAFSSYMLSCSFEAYTEEGFRSYLKSEITLKSCVMTITQAKASSFDYYLRHHLNNYDDVVLMLSDYDSYDPYDFSVAYDCFISVIANWTFEPLMSLHSNDLYSAMLAQNFINMINSFWEKNIDSQKEKIKKYAESLSSANKSLE